MMEKTSPPGTIAWVDLTVTDAQRLRTFYSEVMGWTSSPVDMGGYEDFTMISPASGSAVAGICHARGANADLPAQWLIYVVVTDLDAALARAFELGARVVTEPRSMGHEGRYAVIQDPAGAAVALWQRTPAP